MKKASLKKNLFNGLLFAFVSILFITISVSCEKDSTLDEETSQFIGSWQQVSRTIDGTATSLDSTHLILQIDATNICILRDSTAAAIAAKTTIKRSGWSFSGGSLNIAIDIPASWKATATTNELNLERIDFNQSGTIKKTVLEFKRIANI